MAPVAMLLFGITLSLTYIVGAQDFSRSSDASSISHSSQSKQRLRDIATNHRYMSNGQTQDRRLPETPSLRPGFRYNPSIFHEMESQDHSLTRIDLRWGPWSEWSRCSRTCGGGVAKRYRRCNRRDPNACVGRPVNFILCNTMDCPTGRPTFREEQCTNHSKRRMTGKLAKYHWYPYSSDGTHDTCHIICTARQVHFLQPFGMAIDGTKCGEGNKDTCIDGKCVEVGCDMVIGSKTTVDVCGVCGGNNSTCFHFEDSYFFMPEVTEYLHYNEIAKIPKGSSHIFVKDYSTNYLALLEAGEHFDRYVVNGNQHLSLERKFEAAGTVVMYQRINDTETFEIKGPTTKDLHIMILFTGSVPQIEYDYWIPQSLRPSELVLESSWPIYEYYYASNPEYNMTGESYYEYLPDLPPSREDEVATTSSTSTSETETTTAVATKTTSTSTTVSTSRYSSTTSTSTTTPRIIQRPTMTNTTKSKKCRGKSKTCQKCKKTKARKLSYCQANFTIHAKVLSKKRYHHSSEIRYDIEVISTYKSDFILTSREFIWVASNNCPKLKPLREYLLIGRKVQIDVSDRYSDGLKVTKRRYETRLVVEKSDYWSSWRKSFEKSMGKMARTLQCDRYLRRKLRKNQRKTRAKKSRSRHSV